jgi:hypothetical protein
MKPAELITFFIENAIHWVAEQRDIHRPHARALIDAEKDEFGSFFDPHILDIARIRSVPVVENPGFYSDIRDLQLPRLLDFNTAQGITFKDTILVTDHLVRTDLQAKSIVFHELVHMVQFRALGVTEFIRRYVKSWFENGFSYRATPLETHAHALQERFERDPGKGFWVMDTVCQSLGVRP